MDPINMMCMVSGDFAATNGSARVIRFRDVDGAFRDETYMRYDSEITVTDNRIFGRPTEIHNLLVDIFVPARLTVDRPREVSMHLYGRFYLPNYDLDLDGTGDQPNNGRTDNNPIIEVVAFKRYFLSATNSNEEIPPSLFIRPSVMLIGKVANETQRHPTVPQWCTVDVLSSTFIKSVCKQMRIQLLLKGYVTAWKLQEGSFVFVLGQFSISRGENVASLRVQYINVLSGPTPDFVLPVSALTGNISTMYAGSIDFVVGNTDNNPGAGETSAVNNVQSDGNNSINSDGNESEKDSKESVLRPETESAENNAGTNTISLPEGGAINITINFNVKK